MAASFALALPAFAQTSGLLAHWDFVDGATGSTTLAPEDNGIDCVTPHKVYASGLNYSWTTADSEDGSPYGANGFGGWDDGDYVEFAVTFANEAVGNVKAINFDIANYCTDYDPNCYAVGVYKNGNLQGYVDNQWKSITAVATANDSGQPWSASANKTFDVSQYNLTSTNGSMDTFQFRIITKGADSSKGRIALDNFRLCGTVDCVPEPNGAVLLGLAGVMLILRRRK